MSESTTQRRLGLLDRCLAELDHGLRVVAAAPTAAQPAPVTDADTTTELSAADKSLSSRLMRVNHAGETAAQALYRGQALVARDPELRAHLLEAAAEEIKLRDCGVCGEPTVKKTCRACQMLKDLSLL